MTTTMTAQDQETEERARLEARLAAVSGTLGVIDEQRDNLIEERDSIIRTLIAPPYRVSTRKLGSLGKMTYQNVSLIGRRAGG